jgi:hypothetical protein
MAQTATTLLNVLKEAWTDDQLQKQFEDGNGPLARIEKVKSTMIGKQAQVPIHKSRNLGGYTSVGAGGGSLNTAGSQGVDQASYTLVYHWLSIALDTSALVQASGNNAQAVVSAKDLEIEGGIENVRHQAVRQLMTNGDGIVALCGTTSSSTTVALGASPHGTRYGYDALIRGWLGVGSVIDIGTTADTDVVVTGATVSAISAVAATPTITIGSSVSTTADTHAVYIANPNSATAANAETNGLRNIVNTSGALGGINPSTAGEEFWAAAARDTTTTVFSLDLALSLQRSVMQASGKPQTDVWTGLKQQANFYSLLQNQVRFSSDTEATAGSVSTVKWNGMTVDAFPDVLDSDWACLTLSDLCRISGSLSGPTWATNLSNSGGPLQWAADTTSFKDAVVFPIQVGAKRRNTHSMASGLTA